MSTETDKRIERLTAERDAAMLMVRAYVKDNFHSVVEVTYDGTAKMRPLLPHAMSRFADEHPEFVELALMPALEVERRKRLREALAERTGDLDRTRKRYENDLYEVGERSLQEATKRKRCRTLTAKFGTFETDASQRIAQVTEHLSRVPLIAPADAK